MPPRPPIPEPNQDAGLDLLVVGFGVPVRVAQRLRRGAHAVDDEVVDAALFLRLHPIVGIEGVEGAAARHLRGDFAREVGNVEVLDPGHPRLAGEKPAPGRLDPACYRGNHPKTGNDDAPQLSHACTLAVPAREILPPINRRQLEGGAQHDKGRTRRPARTQGKNVSTKAGRASSARCAPISWSTPFQDT